MTKEHVVEKLLWIDLEMTGLNPETDVILELAMIITDLDFQTLHTWNSPVFQTSDALANMDSWCQKTHKNSGLIDQIASAPSLQCVENQVVSSCRNFFGSDKILLCGNTIGQDRKFIDRYMPTLAAQLHYRMIDVSSFKEIFRYKFNVKFEKKDSHRALDDITESIEELKHYLTFIKVA